MNADQFIIVCDAVVILVNYHLFRIMRRWGEEEPQPRWIYYNATERNYDETDSTTQR
jgi:hypothetical protein